jgi:hypothetical protein
VLRVRKGGEIARAPNATLRVVEVEVPVASTP